MIIPWILCKRDDIHVLQMMLHSGYHRSEVDQLKGSSTSAKNVDGYRHWRTNGTERFSYLLSPEVNDNLFKLLIFGLVCFAELLQHLGRRGGDTSEFHFSLHDFGLFDLRLGSEKHQTHKNTCIPKPHVQPETRYQHHHHIFTKISHIKVLIPSSISQHFSTTDSSCIPKRTKITEPRTVSVVQS